MRPMIEFLNLDDDEYMLAKQMDRLPPEVLELFVRLISDKKADAEEIEREIRAAAERYRKK